MATSRDLRDPMQMISRDGHFSYSETQGFLEGFLEELRQYSNASSHCAVISIMGPQGSGRSCLVNSLFRTNFEVGSQGTRIQTTKGIWIAGVINPRMIIMDTEGIRQGGGLIDQRRIARFVLTVSDVLLLNMWFSEICGKEGLSIEVLQLIFEESVKIDAPQRRTKVIVCVRDHRRKHENGRRVKHSSMQYLEEFFEEFWHAVHPEAMMRDYIEVIIKRFPHKDDEKRDYDQKSKDLAGYVCSLAESGNLKQKHDPYCFAIYSRWAWALNCGYQSPKIELAVSIYECSEIINGILNSLDGVEEYGSLMSGPSSLEDFDAELFVVLNRAQSRYEKETQTFDKKIRDEKKEELVKRIVERFKPAFGDKVASLDEEMCSQALSNLPDQLGKLGELEESAIIQVLRDNYIREFDEISLTGLHPYYDDILSRHRDVLLMRLTKIAEQEKHKIQLKEIEESHHAETKKRIVAEHRLANEKAVLQNIKNSKHKLLEEIEGLEKKNTEQQQERDIILRKIEESLQVETKKRIEAEQQLANEKTMLQNIQKSEQKMLEEIEGLKMQNVGLHNERDKIVRNLEEFRLWMDGLASSNCSNNNVTEFTCLELKEGTNDFDVSLMIGEGGFARVYKGVLRHTKVAIKVLKQQSRHEESDFTHEVEILRRVRHPNLVVLIGVCPEAHALVYEFMPNGNLQDLLKKQPRFLTWKTRICVASNICSGLIFLHSVYPHGIVHSDLKPANILLDANYIGKLSDFGISRHLSQTDMRMTPHHQTDKPKGTLPYMDPEYFQSAELTPQYDVYSFGIVLLELVTGRDPQGLRKLVEDAIRKGELKKFVDASAGKWPFEEAKKMVELGLRCSDLSRKNRPDLVKNVWYEIELMKHVALSH